MTDRHLPVRPDPDNPDHWIRIPRRWTPEMDLAFEAAMEREANRGILWQIRYGWDAALAAAPKEGSNDD